MSGGKGYKRSMMTHMVEFRVASYAIHECCSCNIYLISVYTVSSSCIAIATSCHSVIVVLYM